MRRTQSLGVGMLALALALTGAARAQPLIPRLPPEKPAKTSVAPSDARDRVVLKFQAGAQLRLAAGRFVGAPAEELASLEAVLEAHTIPPDHIQRLFTRPKRELDAERATAQRRSGRELADLNLYYAIELPAGGDVGRLCDGLNALGFVELASPAPAPVPPPVDIPPTTPDFTRFQGYRSPAPEGIGVPDPALVPGADGAGTALVDVEYSWVLDHEDLELDSSANIDSATGVDPFPDEGSHGTAVLGVLGGRVNGYGVSGIVPATALLVAPAYTVEFGYNAARAISLATAVLDSGDVILIEQGTYVCDDVGFGPLEWYQDVFDAIATATALGIVVVEAAGNGAVNLDDPSCQGRFDLNQRDSGAIMVGAGFFRARLWFSSYGSRVDLQGWGIVVTTTGYGDRFDPGDLRQRYTGLFSGTSSASAIVAGAALAVQGAALARGLPPLDPLVLRQLLVETGTPQYRLDPPEQHIGPLPSIPDAIAALQVVVEIDIKPGSAVNPIHPRSRGVIPVAILGAETLDVADVDVRTLAFGPDGATLGHGGGPQLVDVNGDGFPDLLAHFRTQEADVAFGDTEACVSGALVDGTPFEGCDSVSTEPPGCGRGFELALAMPALIWLRQRRLH